MSRIFILPALALAILMLASPLIGSSEVFADSRQRVCQELPDSLRDECLGAGASETTGIDTIETFMSALTWLAGGISVIAIIVGGLMAVLSGGDSKRVVQAREIVLYALVGLVFVFAARLIVQFIISSL